MLWIIEISRDLACNRLCREIVHHNFPFCLFDKLDDRYSNNNGPCKLYLSFEFTSLQWMKVPFFKRVSTSTSLCACLGYDYISGHNSCIHNGLHAGKWPDLMISKPDYVSTMRYHWTDYTGTTLLNQPSISHSTISMPLTCFSPCLAVVFDHSFEIRY